MGLLLFFEKPGCRTNRRQKERLTSAGISFRSVNILQEPWTRSRLYDFFSGLSVDQWFNQNAPDIKTGKININEFDEDSAISAMLKDPLLIKRPLFEYGQARWSGFDTDKLKDLFGIDITLEAEIPTGCSHSSGEQKCK